MNNPKSSALVSLAGPLANLAIIIITAMVIRVGIVFDFFYPPDFLSFTMIVSPAHGGIVNSLAIFLSILFSLNVLLFVFNLLPFPPLDGSGILPLFFRSEEFAVRYLRFIHSPAVDMAGILISWRVLDFIFRPAHLAIVNTLYWGLAVY
jgi:Zn-dependent protease